MKNLLPVIIAISLVSIVTTGCYYDKEEVLYPNNNCDTADVKYSSQITYIVSNKCYECHSNASAPLSGSNQSFEGYANISGYMANSSSTFINAIKHVAGYPVMPQNNPKLSECEIRTIEIWVLNGYPNN